MRDKNLTEDEKKDFSRWLERMDFFTTFASGNPDLGCAISICVYPNFDDIFVRVFYGPKVIVPCPPNWYLGSDDNDWMKGYGDHGVDPCEIYGINSYVKYLPGYQPTGIEEMTWLDVYNNLYVLEVRDRKLNQILGND